MKGGGRNVLSAGVPRSRLGLAGKRLALGAELPRHGRDAEHDGTGDERVGAPVGGLGVPTTGR